MNEVVRISKQLGSAYEGEAWHGPSLREALSDVSAPLAAARPLSHAHTIWEIVNHLAAWNGAVRRRLEGERVDTPEEGDWPTVMDTSDAAWNHTLAWLEKSYQDLHGAVAGLDDARLDEAIVEDSGASIYVTLHGTIQHYLYHAGQIALLKKA